MQFDKDMASPHRDLFLKVREILLSRDGVVETKKQRITTYSIGNSGICHMRTMPHGIDIGFLKGAKLEDKYDVLTGSGKLMRVLSLENLNTRRLSYYVTQALAINQKLL